MTVYCGGGTVGSPWVNPNNLTDPSSYATATLSAGSIESLFVGASQFGYALPFGLNTTGIQVDIEAFSSSVSSATLYAVLFVKGNPIGLEKSLGIIDSNENYTFGGNMDLWGLDNVPVSILNDPTFGVAFALTDVTGATEYLRNVRCTVYGDSPYNLELIAYENADLSGSDSYDLTNIHRGVYGSYPIDHPAGTQFIRLDNNVLKYQVDPTYRGQNIYFKFCSFNAYGNQLQSQASVVAYTVPILQAGSAPGAIDSDTGALTTGTSKSSVAQLDPVVAAAHGSFGIESIPEGYVWAGPAGAGSPQWVPATIFGGSPGPAGPTGPGGGPAGPTGTPGNRWYENTAPPSTPVGFNEGDMWLETM